MDKIGSEGNEIVADYTSSFQTDQLFATRDDLLGYVRSVSRNLGMVTVINRSDNGAKLGKISCELVCVKAEKHKHGVKIPTGSRKCCCKVRLKGKFIKRRVGWILSVMCGIHNHALQGYPQGHPYDNKLTAEQKEHVARMTQNLIPPNQMQTSCGMTPLSELERKRLCAEQKKKQGYSDPPTISTPTTSPAPSHPVVHIPDDSVPHEGSLTKGPSKKRKLDAEALGSLVNAGATDPPADPSWQKHCEVVTSATAEGPVKTAWDSRYPFNRVLNSAIPLGDREKAAAMGFGPAMTTVKTYGLWSSIMAQLVESSFMQAMEESGRLEKDLEGAKARVISLQADVQKYADSKSILEGKISRLSREARNSSARVKVLEGDLESVSKKLEVALLQLAEAQSVPASERYETPWTAYEKLELDTLSSFNNGFHTVVSQFRVLHPGPIRHGY